MRGLKCGSIPIQQVLICRTSHGVRGLKFAVTVNSFNYVASHLAWGAWIEMTEAYGEYEIVTESHLAWGAWIEILRCGIN